VTSISLTGLVDEKKNTKNKVLSLLISSPFTNWTHQHHFNQIMIYCDDNPCFVNNGALWGKGASMASGRKCLVTAMAGDAKGDGLIPSQTRQVGQVTRTQTGPPLCGKPITAMVNRFDYPSLDPEIRRR